MKAVEAFAKMVTECPFVETERAKQHLVYLFDRALKRGGDVRFVFPDDQVELAREVTLGFRNMVQFLGFEDFSAMLTQTGATVGFACSYPEDDDPNPEPYEMGVLFGGPDSVTKNEIITRGDIAPVIELTEETVAEIAAIELPQLQQ